MHLLYATVHLNLKKSVLISYSRIGIFIMEKKLSLQPSMFLTSHYGCCSVFFFSFVRRDCSCTFSLFYVQSIFGERTILLQCSGLPALPTLPRAFPVCFLFFTTSLPKTCLIHYKHTHFALILSDCRGEERPSSDTVCLSSFFIFPLLLTSSNMA